MVDGGGMNISRRQLLLVGGSGAALIWAGRSALARAVSTEATAVGSAGGSAVGSARSPSARDLAAPPFTETFANAALPAWNVRRPVAILGTTPFGFAYPANQALDRPGVLSGRGTVIGLDGPLAGSTTPGLLETADTFVFEPGASYTLRFSVAGSQQKADRLPPSTLTASLPGLGVARQVTRQPHDGFLDHTLEVPVTEPAMSTIVFASENTPGQAGLLLESVSLTRTG